VGIPANLIITSEIASRASALVVTKTMEPSHRTPINAHLIREPVTPPKKEIESLAIFIVSEPKALQPINLLPFVGERRREFESSLSLDRPPLRCGHPRHIGADSAVTAAKNKKGHLTATLCVSGGGGGSLSFAGRRPAHHASLRSPTLPFGRVFSCLAGQTKRPPLGWPSCLLVEAAGVEPASASTLPLALHA